VLSLSELLVRNRVYAYLPFCDSLRLFNAAQSLKLNFRWTWKRRGHEVVSAAWGAGRSQRKLVAGTQQTELVEGRLVLVDAIAGRAVSFIDAEACSTLSVDPTGKQRLFHFVHCLTRS
jgi:hypothetical protein